MVKEITQIKSFQIVNIDLYTSFFLIGIRSNIGIENPLLWSNFPISERDQTNEYYLLPR